MIQPEKNEDTKAKRIARWVFGVMAVLMLAGVLAPAVQNFIG